MIFGNLTDVLEGEKPIYEAYADNVITNAMRNGNDRINISKQSRISKILKTLSQYGMNYDKQVIRNIQTVPADKTLMSKDDLYIQQAFYGNFANWKVKAEEDKKFSEKTLEQRRKTLRTLAMQPELEDILDIMANECIVYDDDESYIGQPFIDTGLVQDLNEKSASEIRSAVDTVFYKIYTLLNWKTSAWDMFKRYLIDGVLAFEIIYDNLENPKSIIGIVEVDPITLTKDFDAESSTFYWTQFKGQEKRERKLLDAQIIYVKYEDSGVVERQSYLERLIRPFNLYRIVEQAQVIWTVTQSSFKTLFTIPIGGMNKAKGMQTLASTMNRYKEDISFNTESGELTINGKTNLPFNKEYWLPENENGRPEIETLVDTGPQLNDSDQLKYFEAKLYKMSKIPISRFDSEAQTTWFGSDATQQMRDEINFGRFVTRLRNSFVQILLKPLRIQVSLNIPDIKNDKRILDAISFRWHTYNQFTEMMDIEIMTKRIEFIGTMKDSLVVQEGEEEVPYFSPKFLIMKYLKMSEADLELNEKYKMEEKLAKKGKESDDEDEEMEDTEMDDMEGSEDEGDGETGGGELDDEMLGDVQPESPETTEA